MTVDPFPVREGAVVADALKMRRVGVTFADGTAALRGVDLTVAANEFVCIVGPSGCGKTTLLRLVAGLSDPSEGMLRVAMNRLGYVFQDPTLLPWRTVRQNVELLSQLDRLPKRDRRDRRDAAIALVGLQHFAGHYPHQLSGGMRMRTSLARALTMEPDLFLLDEPFGALDELTRQRLNDELQALFVAKRFTTALFVTHSIAEAVFLASRVVVMSDRPGTIIGEVEIPFSYPRSPALRYGNDFAALAGRVSGLLRQEQS
ncbi:ABC transporter ATP-binding protein [Kribbella sp. NPDC004536]|uniref:ABC transporter ATP-binding protein n=1 Tax=Kribbella sp. NPDC004536 TaxID=3364106 RepID=UPI003694A48A